MKTETIGYTEGGDEFDVFVARPDGEGPWPAVMVCHAWGGRDAFIEEKATKLAELGYVAAATDMYGVGKRGTDNASCEALMTPLVSEPARLRGRLKAAYDVVQKLDGVDAERMGCIGYCFGGMCAILAARMGLDLRGIVSFHGLLKIGAQLPEKPKARMLILHGQNDPLAPPEDIGPFAAEMKRLDADWQLHAYPNVMHAFTNPKANDPDFGTVYDAGADKRSWDAMKQFLAETLTH